MQKLLGVEALTLTLTVNKREFAEVAEGLINCSLMIDPDLSCLLLARDFFLRTSLNIPKRQLRKVNTSQFIPGCLSKMVLILFSSDSS